MSDAARHTDIVIVGAGAAGLFAAIFAARAAPPGTRVVALDGAKKLGTKILIAGGGRCNVTHDVVRVEDYAGGPAPGKSSRNAIKKVLRSFTVDDTIDFFRGRGVTLKREDTGKLFPTTDKARTVLDALLGAAREAGAELRTDCRVTGIERRRDSAPRFTLTTSQGPLHANRVILCTGGRALPASGSDGLGYELAKALGHTVTRTWPALVPMTYANDPTHAPGSAPGNNSEWLKDLKGIAVEAVLSVQLDTGKVLHQQAGSLLLTHFGISGPAAMDISRHLTAARRQQGPSNVQLVANLVPPHAAESLDAELVALATSQPRRTVSQVVERFLPARFAAAVVEHAANLPPQLPLSQLPKDGRRALVRALTALPIPVSGDRGYDYAEVTAGGVPLAEVELATMRSRVCDGLHLAGELLDVDGRIGGYNFQWAWCTGRLAGLGAAKALH